MRITAGNYKGRKLNRPNNNMVRPTSDRTRQAIFNILLSADYCPDLDGMRALDVFCGSGSLGLDAYSRGCSDVTFIDQNIDLITSNIALFNDAPLQAIKANCTRLRPNKSQPFDLIFIDPPYNKDLINPCLEKLIGGNWIANDAVIIIETEREYAVRHDGLDIKTVKNYGLSQITLCVYNKE